MPWFDAPEQDNVVSQDLQDLYSPGGYFDWHDRTHSSEIKKVNIFSMYCSVK